MNEKIKYKNGKSVFGSDARSMSCFTFVILNEFVEIENWEKKTNSDFLAELEDVRSFLFFLRTFALLLKFGKLKGVLVTNS